MDAHEYMCFSLKFEYFMCFWLTSFLVQFFYWFPYVFDRFSVRRVYRFNDRSVYDNYACQ